MNKEDFEMVGQALLGSLCGNETDVYGEEGYLGTAEITSTWGKYGLVEGTYEKDGLVHYFTMNFEMTSYEEEIG